MSSTDSSSSSATTPQAGPGASVAILGLGGDAVGDACEFVEQLGLQASILDAVSIDQLEGLRHGHHLTASMIRPRAIPLPRRHDGDQERLQ